VEAKLDTINKVTAPTAKPADKSFNFLSMIFPF
jgi:hypothetical protein